MHLQSRFRFCVLFLESSRESDRFGSATFDVALRPLLCHAHYHLHGCPDRSSTPVGVSTPSASHHGRFDVACGIGHSHCYSEVQHATNVLADARKLVRKFPLEFLSIGRQIVTMSSSENWTVPSMLSSLNNKILFSMSYGLNICRASFAVNHPISPISDICS